MGEIFINRRDAGNIPSFRFENGTARPPRYTLGMSGHDWQLALLESGTLYVLDTMLVDLFAVGGGQGGVHGSSSTFNPGGNSGTVATRRRIRLSAGARVLAVVGAGGTGGSLRDSSRNGGTTSLYVYGATHYIDAAGGAGYRDGSTWRDVVCGSGAGCAVRPNLGMPYGGRNGANGGGDAGCPGSGQTTRAFGEADGLVYAQGGCGWIRGDPAEYQFQELNLMDGGGYGAIWTSQIAVANAKRATSGAPNTGSGGGGGENSTNLPAGNGGSGVILIRNARG